MRTNSHTNSNKARAELLFKKEQRLREGQIAAAAYEAAYEAEQQSIRQKTARLRALRMARDAKENAGRLEADPERGASGA
jgi:hypothetical protein